MIEEKKIFAKTNIILYIKILCMVCTNNIQQTTTNDRIMTYTYIYM